MLIEKTTTLVTLLLLFVLSGAVYGDDITMNLSNSSVVDLGTHSLDEKITQTLRLYNNSSKPVHIKKIESSCSCIAVLSSPDEVKPGGYAKIRLEIRNASRREGPFTKTLWIITGKKESDIYTIKIKAFFKANKHNLIARPRFIDLGSVCPNSTLIRSVRITRRGWVPIGKLKVISADDFVSVKPQNRTGEEKVTSADNQLSIKTQEENAEQRRFHIFVDVPCDANKINSDIILGSGKEDDFVRIRMRANILSKVSVYPDTVLVTPEEKEYKLSVTTLKESCNRLRSYRFKSDNLKLEFLDSKINSSNFLFTTIKRKGDYSGFAQGILTLYYKGIEKPVKVLFVSPPL